jgi:hypothetical protein
VSTVHMWGGGGRGGGGGGRRKLNDGEVPARYGYHSSES